MTQENFLYWLKGYLEMARTPIEENQIESIQERLDSVLTKKEKSLEKNSLSVFFGKEDADGYSLVESKEPAKRGEFTMDYSSIKPIDSSLTIIISENPRFIAGNTYKVFYDKDLVSNISDKIGVELGNIPIVIDSGKEINRPASICSGNEKHIAGLSHTGVGMTNVGVGPRLLC